MTDPIRDPFAKQRLIMDACLKHLVPFFWRSRGTLLISGKGIGVVIEELQDSGVDVIGMEGFDLDGSAVLPRLDLIYSSPSHSSDGPASVVATWGQDVWVDLTIRPAT